MREFVRPNVVVSKCVGFDACRWNAEIIQVDFIKKLKSHVNFITVCPEVEIGLGVPRSPIKIVSVKGERKLIQLASGNDLTEKMLAFADVFLASLMEIDGFILKSRSPSCGIKDVEVFPSSENVSAISSNNAGFFGGKVLDMFSDLAIEDENRLNDFKIREHFLTKLFTLSSFRKVKKSSKMAELIHFHTLNKFLLRVYNLNELKILERIVANPKKKEFDEVIISYEEHLKHALNYPSRCTSNIHVLMHAFGYFSKELLHEEKAFSLETLERYRKGKIPLSMSLLILKSWIRRFDARNLMEQTFFEPYPADLVDVSSLT